MAEAKKKQKTEPKKADQKLDHSQDYKCVGTGKSSHIKKGQELSIKGDLAEILIKKGAIELK